jgi:hypothetical protein
MKTKISPIDPIGQANLGRAIQLLQLVIQGLVIVQEASDTLDKQKQSRPYLQSVRQRGQRKRSLG